jgi:vitamin K-dependent gamma-carboxylase
MATETGRSGRSVAPEGLAFFRSVFGCVLVFSTLRFVWSGWVETLLIAPAYHFTYPGFGWVRPLPAPLMYGVFAVTGLSALLLAFGRAVRPAAAAFFVSFTYVELIDQATYLNHYYFVSLVALLLVVFPCDEAFSFRRRGAASIPKVQVDLFRLQVAVVYLFAGFAKLNSDWLLRAEPLHSWLALRVDVHPILAEPWLAFAMSWAGASFDLTVPLLLSWRRSRLLAYAAVVVFHLVTWLLFPIGVFPWVMMAAATVFFPPDWPRQAWAKVRGSALPVVPGEAPPRPLSRPALAFALAFGASQVLLPLRFVLEEGWVNWHEQGFRFSWRVMLIEKAGMVDYEVTTVSGARYREFPRHELTSLQYRMMSTQPDLIAQYGRHLADEYNARGLGPVAVHARSFAALNRRPSQVLVRSDVNLAGPLPQGWIAPFEEGKSPQAHAVRR